jgi:hypothetical protein
MMYVSIIFLWRSVPRTVQFHEQLHPFVDSSVAKRILESSLITNSTIYRTVHTDKTLLLISFCCL